jgi:hypothetical protein
MRANFRTIALVTTVAAGSSLALAAPVGASPSGSSSEIAGVCSAGSTFQAELELKGEQKRKGKARTKLRTPIQAFEFEVRTALAGQDWTLTVTGPSGVIYQSTRPSVLSDDDDVVASLRDRGGDDDDAPGSSSDDDSDDDDSDASNSSGHGSEDADDADDDSDDGSRGSSSDGVSGHSHDSDDDSEDSDDDSDDSDDSIELAKVEWKSSSAPSAGSVTFTAVNAATGETCSTVLPGGTPVAGG